MLFFESERQQAVVEKTSRYFPPASSHKNEFHILKFYSFSSSLVGAILSKSDLKVLDYKICFLFSLNSTLVIRYLMCVNK